MDIITLQLNLSIILVCLLVNIVFFKISQAEECITGHVENQMSRNKFTCCRNFCEDKSNTYYNPDQCCMYPTCQKYYKNICKLVLPDATNELITAEHTRDMISISPIPQTVVAGVPVSQSKTTSTYATQMLLTRSSERALTLDIGNATEKNESLITLPETTQEENTLQNTDYTATSILSLNTTSPVGNKFNMAINLMLAFVLVIAALIYIMRKKCSRMVNRPVSESDTNDESNRRPFSEDDIHLTETTHSLYEVPSPNAALLAIMVETQRNFLNADNSSAHTYENLTKEIQDEDVVVDKVLGRGHFGQVHQGTLKKDPLTNLECKVALKTATTNSDLRHQAIQCLQLELRILVFVGHHINIVKLMGTIRKPNCELVLVTELCELGELQSHIKGQKLSHEIFSLDKSYGNELKGILERNALCLSALLMYALQIANGAHYLIDFKNVIHRDFALRNMFLTKQHIVKIGDFGLAVNLAANENFYKVKSEKPLPIKWLAPESLHGSNATFTAQSDVWSFGVLLWEMFSLAESPAEIRYVPKVTEQFRLWLLRGNRFLFPDYATPAINQLMTICWNEEPNSRPTFQHCKTIIESNLIDYSPDVYRYVAQKINL